MTRLKALLDRHAAFWEFGRADRALVGVARTPANPLLDFDWGLPPGEGLLEPDMIVTEHLIPQFERYLLAGDGPFDGDLFWPCVPTRSIPWIEAMVGAPIRYASRQDEVSIFADHIAADRPELPQPPRLDGNPWFEKLSELVEALVELSAGAFPIAGSHTRGPWDVLSATHGMTGLLTGLYDDPESLMAEADRLAGTWIEVTERLEAMIPTWHGGHVGIFGLWAPGYVPTAQNDVSVSVSPAMYRDVMAPADRRTCSPWRHQMFHTHSGGSHLLGLMAANLSEGGAMNVVLDPGGPPLDDVVPILRRILADRIPLHLAVYTDGDVTRLAHDLGPRGLAITRVAGGIT